MDIGLIVSTQSLITYSVMGGGVLAATTTEQGSTSYMWLVIILVWTGMAILLYKWFNTED